MCYEYGKIKTVSREQSGLETMKNLSKVGRFCLALMIALVLSISDQRFALANAKYSSIVTDAYTGKVLLERNADKRLYPASLTKMMTLYLAFEAVEQGKFSMNSRLKVSRAASNEPPSKLGLRRGGFILMRDAIQACATKSANDAATVLAEALGGSKAEFARIMTRKARQMGMRNTRFKNPHGLTQAGQYSTARDMAILGQRLFADFPQYYDMFKRKRFKYGKRNHRATNKLLGTYKGADGIKTGYTRASGYNLVASAERNGQRLIGVVFGGKSGASRNRHMKAILDEGFKKLPKLPPKPVYVTSAPPKVSPLPRNKPGTVEASPVIASVLPVIQSVPRAPSAIVAMKTANDPWTVANGLRALQNIIAPKENVKVEVAGEWSVQIGAFRKLSQAEKILEKAKALKSPQLLRAAPIVTRRQARGRPIYRARFTGLARGQAENACRSLSRRGIACFAVKTSG